MPSPPEPAGAVALHFVVSSVYPVPGGMQDSVLRVARGLARDGFETAIYTQKQPEEYIGAAPEHAGLRVVHLGGDAAFLREPFESLDASVYATDRMRIDVLLLRAEIERAVRRRPDKRHLLISFYAAGSGFLAQQVASRLNLPHLAAFRGTDFSRDIYGPPGRNRIEAVVAGARALATTNREQAAGLRTMLGARQPIHTIHNAFEGETSLERRPLWRLPPHDPVRLLSDSGFSGRKATQALLRAVGRLVDRGLPVKLTLLGGVAWPREKQYWEGVRQDCEARYHGVFSFPGQRPRDEMDGYLREAHVYCSATLSEGCSLSRVRALTLGIPIVTTRCGALAEVAEGCRHVWLAAPGDWRELAGKLEEAVRRIRTGELEPDRERVAAWRRHFSLDRERAEWREAVDAALR